MCRKINPYSLFLGIQIGEAMLDIRLEKSQQKLNINVPLDPAMLLLSISPKVLTSYFTDTCSAIFIAALFNFQEMKTI